MTVKERLIEFIKSKGMSARAFCRRCEVSSAFVSNIGQSITGASLDKISMQFPELNLGWLLSGEGNMLKGQNANSTLQTDDITISSEVWTVIKQQAASLESRDSQINELIGMLKQQLQTSLSTTRLACSQYK